MGIPLPQLLGSTPDALQNVNQDLNTTDETKTNRFVWYFRRTSDPGLDIKITPEKVNGEWAWTGKIYDAVWDGEDYSRDVRHDDTYDDFITAISCSEKRVKKICNTETDLSWII